MSLFPNITPIFLDYIIGLLAPLFRTAAGGDLEAARHTAKCLLASYDVETEDEIRLVAEIASFSFGALDALGKSMDPDLSLNAILRLRGSANAQHRSAHQCERSLDKLRKERRTAVATTETAPPAPEPPADRAVAEQAPHASPPQPHPEVTVSRQQRRAMQRAIEKAQRKQAEQARRDAMQAMRTDAKPAVGPHPSPAVETNPSPAAETTPSPQETQALAA
jgi:hypothetical protein